MLSEHVDQPFDEMDKGDVKDIVEWIQSRDLAEATVKTYKEIIRIFLTWVHRDEIDDDEEPDCVKWMENKSVKTEGKLPQDLLTKSDVEEQVEAANIYRDKALIMLLYETGARIGELIDLTVGDIEDRKHGKKVVIDGKTGSRRLPLVESVPYMNRWLNDHPDPEKDAPLWCKIQSYTNRDPENGELKGEGKAGEQLGYRYIRDKILTKTMDKAGIDKPSNPHHYRHSRASYLANYMTESQLCEWFGWVQGSDVPAKYVHLSGRDLDNAYDEMHAFREEEEPEDEANLKTCKRCSYENRPKASYCDECGFELAKNPEDLPGVDQSGIAELLAALLGLDDPSDLNDPTIRKIIIERTEGPINLVDDETLAEFKQAQNG